MPKIVPCASCQQTMTLAEDMAGKLVRCPHCKTTFTVNVDGKPHQPSNVPVHVPLPSFRVREIDSVEGRPIVANRPSPHWSTVRSGINLIYLSVLVFFVTALLCVPLFFCAGVDRFAAFEIFALLDLAGCGMAIVVVFCGVTCLTGLLSCLATPYESGARGVLNGVLLSLMGYILLLAVVAIADDNARRAWRGPEFDLFTVLRFINPYLLPLAAVLFVQFLGRLAHFHGDTTLARTCQAYMIFFIVSVAAFHAIGYYLTSVGIGFADFFVLRRIFVLDATGLWLIVTFFVATNWVVSTAWFLYLLRQTRNLLDAAHVDSRPSRFADF